MREMTHLETSLASGGMIGGGYGPGGIPLLECGGADQDPCMMEGVTIYGEAGGWLDAGLSLNEGAMLGSLVGGAMGLTGWTLGMVGAASLGEAMAVGVLLGGIAGVGAVLIGAGIVYFLFR